jgi:hypothetical protein
MNEFMDRGASERGAVLVQTAIAILVLVGFLTFVLDYGVLWIARAQAQNSADAGALAAAIARAFDPGVTIAVSDEIARKAALANKVWNASTGDQYVDVFIDQPAKCPADSPSCVRVEVYRNKEHGTPLPTVFGSVLGIADQGVKATASAIYANANASDCMRPFSVPDRWIENYPTPKAAPDPTDLYNHWVKVANKRVQDPLIILPKEPDQYKPPTETTVGSGYRHPEDVGVKWTLSVGNESQVDKAKASWYFPVDLPDGKGGYTTGVNDWPLTIGGCIGNMVTIGDYLPTHNGLGAGQMDIGMDMLIAKDKDASWDEGTKRPIGTCADDPTPCASFSPRIVPISVFDMEEFQWRSTAGDWTTTYYDASRCATGCSPSPGVAGNSCVRVVNILGFFVNNPTYKQGDDIVGYLTTDPGKFVKGKPSVGTGSSFLKVIQLVR